MHEARTRHNRTHETTRQSNATQDKAEKKTVCIARSNTPWDDAVAHFDYMTSKYSGVEDLGVLKQ